MRLSRIGAHLQWFFHHRAAHRAPVSIEGARAGIAALVEPLVTVADAVPLEIREAGRRLVDDGAVTLDHAGPLSVTARVRDADVVHKVALGSTSGGLASRCGCERGATGLVCPHALATAIETWRLRRGLSD
jgi:hypothetical protein